MLDALKKHGEMRVEALSAAAGITVSGARQHLNALEMDGLVGRREERSGPGRPRLYYRLTPAGDGLYPRTYAELTNELLEYVGDDDPELLERIFQRRGQRRLQAARTRLASLASLGERVRELARILDEDGYLAECEAIEGGGFRITEHNCAVLGVAMKYGHACGSEIDFLRAALPDARVERIAHIVAGAHHCAYLVEPLQ
jgi:DeoR family suf operon transcriptional repressor